MNNKKIKNKESKVVKTGFDNFNYVVVPSPLKDFKEVRVMFTYLGKPVTHHLFIAENGSKNNDYYIAEAKKIINEEIANGTLPKQSKHYYKPKKVSTAGKVAIAVLAVAAVGCGSFLTYKYLYPNYTVSFDTNGGSSIEAQSVQRGYLAKEPEDPTKLGYAFGGWRDEEDKAFDFEKTPINKNTTVYAYWIEDNVTVTFHYNNESIPGTEKVPVLKGHTIEASQIPDISDTYVGHTFVGWLDEDDDEFDFDKQILADTDIYADWDTNEYTVNYVTNGGTAVLPTTGLEYGDTLDEPECTYLGHTLDGWYTSPTFDAESKFAFAGETNPTPITDNITLYAKWTENWIAVTFDYSEGPGGDPVSVNVLSGYKLEASQIPTPPTYEGHTFDNWYTKKEDGTFEKFNLDTEITEAKTIYAIWTTDKYIVTYDSMGGSEVEPKKDIPYDGTIATAPDMPSKYGYTFEGWYKDYACSDNNEFKFGDATTGTHVKSNMTIYAKWEKDTAFHAVFDPNGASWTDKEEEEKLLPRMDDVEFGAIPADPKDKLEYPGHTFVGWKRQDGGMGIIPAYKNNEIYTAQWVVATHNVNYHFNYTIAGRPEEVFPYPYAENETIYEPSIIPTREGYTFTRWYKDAACTQEYQFPGTMGTADINLYAGWSENTTSANFMFINATTGISMYRTLDVVSTTGTTTSLTANAGQPTAIVYKPSELAFIYTLSELDDESIEPDLTKGRITITIDGTPITSDKFNLGEKVGNTFRITLAEGVKINSSLTIQVTGGE